MRTGPERGEVVSIFGQAASNSGVDQLGEGSVRFGGLHPKGLMQGWFKIDCGTFGIAHGRERSALTLRRQDVITLLGLHAVQHSTGAVGPSEIDERRGSVLDVSRRPTPM